MSLATDLHQHLSGAAGTPSVAEANAAHAVEDFMTGARPDLATGDPAVFVYASADRRVQHGCVLLAARLHARRQTPVGVTPGFDGAGEVIRSVDPDVSRLLGLGRYAKPSVVA